MTAIAIETTGYALTDDSAIWGIGLSRADAWADLEAEMRRNQVRIVSDAEALLLADHPHLDGFWVRRSDFSITPATAGLLAEVYSRGGNIGWGIVGGVFCTRDEQDCGEAWGAEHAATG